MITSRYLGPSNYGQISYAAAVVAFFSPMALLGLNEVMVQEIVNNPEKEGEVLGSGIGMSIISAFLCMLGVFAFSTVANPGETTTIVVCVLYSSLLLFQGFELIRYWFQAKFMAKYSSLAAFCAYLVASIYKIVLLINGSSLYWFALSHSIEYLVLALFLFLVFKRKGKKKLAFSSERAMLLLRKSCYYIIPNLMIVIFGQTDRVMLKMFIDETATGIYSAAYTCAGIGGFVLTAIVDSMRPSIFEGLKESEQLFETRLKQLFCIVIYASIVKNIVIVVLAKPLVNIVHGPAFIGAVDTLKWIVWYITFSEIGVIRNIWVLAKGQQKWLLTVNIAGAISNIVLNLLLIPMFGTVGAAIATVVTQVIANIAVTYCLQPLRKSTILMFESINPKLLVGIIRKIIK